MSEGLENTAGTYLSTLLFAAQPPRVLPPAIDLQVMLKDHADAVERIRLAEQQCMAELDLLREHARRAGYQAGLQQGLSELEQPIDDMKYVVSHYQDQIVGLVIQCVRKICNSISPDLLMPKLIEQTLEEQVAELKVTVTVHPEIAPALSESGSNNISIETNSELLLTDAVVETADHIKLIGLDTQISRLHNQLQRGENQNLFNSDYDN